MTTPVINHDSLNGEMHRGLGFRMLVKITVDQVVKDLSGSTLTVTVVSRDHSRALTSALALSGASPANLAQGLVNVVIPSSETAKVLEAEADLLILETDGTGEKWGHYKQVHVSQGLPA